MNADGERQVVRRAASLAALTRARDKHDRRASLSCQLPREREGGDESGCVGRGRSERGRGRQSGTGARPAACSLCSLTGP